MEAEDWWRAALSVWGLVGSRAEGTTGWAGQGPKTYWEARGAALWGDLHPQCSPRPHGVTPVPSAVPSLRGCLPSPVQSPAPWGDPCPQCSPQPDALRVRGDPSPAVPGARGWPQVSHPGQAPPTPCWVTAEGMQQGCSARPCSSPLS